MQMKQKAEKITITIPHDLKMQLLLLKEERDVSLSAIYKEALEAYIRQEEIEKWEKGAQAAALDEEYMRFVQEIGDDQEDVYEY